MGYDDDDSMMATILMMMNINYNHDDAEKRNEWKQRNSTVLSPYCHVLKCLHQTDPTSFNIILISSSSENICEQNSQQHQATTSCCFLRRAGNGQTWSSPAGVVLLTDAACRPWAEGWWSVRPRPQETGSGLPSARAAGLGPHRSACPQPGSCGGSGQGRGVKSHEVR